ncbi:MAG: ECF-type riboflavin transporter substrate-binding protein [Actinomycetaceae bacterium]|nr:ECF-type riboflavin transporter substrate-binding protein [Actinomycetaceae bacterium]
MSAFGNSASPAVKVVATGIGAALFFVFGRFVAIPTPVPNTTISIQYALLAVFALLYGPVVAGLIGFIGHWLIDATTYGPWWSWIIASAVAGLVMGALMVRAQAGKGRTQMQTLATFNVAALVACVVSWGVVAPLLDIAIYAEPASKVFTQGVVAGVSNALTTCILGSIIVVAYLRTLTQDASLRVEE